jgi:ATP:ADP antiporter, AAA family
MTSISRLRAGWLERGLAPLARIEVGEAGSALVLALHAFLLMTSYYVLKTAREPLLLAGGSAELKSYAQAAIAAVLLLLVPPAVWLARRVDRRRLLQGTTLFCAFNLVILQALYRIVDIGFLYYVWVGVFGVMLLAQFWAHAAKLYGAERGRRLFPLLMTGAAVGGLLGPALCSVLFAMVGPANLLALGGALLALTAPLARYAEQSAPTPRVASIEAGATAGVVGISAVLRHRYLLLLAAVVVLLNCVSTTGDYLLTRLLLEQVERDIALDASLDRGAIVAAFYSRYYFVVNVLTVLIQLLLVSRVLRSIGVRSAILVAPTVALIGYGLTAIVPAFAVLRIVKIVESSLNYSVMSTARQVLYLPLSLAEQNAGRMTIETLCFRLGDVLQAAFVAIGVGALALTVEQFALLNAALGLVWAGAALRLGRLHPPETLERLRFDRQAVAAALCLGVGVFAASIAPISAKAATLFDADEPLAIALALDERALCGDCAPTRVVLSYTDETGTAHAVAASARVRGVWRATDGHCRVPPLFIAFDDAGTTDPQFLGEKLLPLTTHCRDSAVYEQYVLKEYLAYRIYNLVASVSLRVRLVRVAYEFGGDRPRLVERYAFFTENFASLASRYGASVSDAEPSLERLDAAALATLELFEYLIGNTDWSVLRRHNVVMLDTDGALVAVPYDFDFSGLVNALYATPPPQLGINSVTRRVFRGFCRDGEDWAALVASFETRREAIDSLISNVPGLTQKSREDVRRYVASFFAIASSPVKRGTQIVAACRASV